jgi:hypothetical protein
VYDEGGLASCACFHLGELLLLSLSCVILWIPCINVFGQRGH